MAAPSLRGVGTLGTAEGGNATPGLPSGWKPGDIHVMLAASDRNNAISVPTSWKAKVSEVDPQPDLTLLLAWRRAESGDEAPVMASGASTALAVRIAGFSGALETGDPFDVVGDDDGSGGENLEADSVYLDVRECLLLMACWGQNDFEVSGYSGGLTEVFDSKFNAVTAKDSTLALASQAVATTGSTGDRTAKFSSGAIEGIAHLLGLMPADAVWEVDSLDQVGVQEPVAGRISESTTVVCPGTTHNTTYRFDCRKGEFTGGDEGVNRTEIFAAPVLGVDHEVTRWYRWQTQFDSGYDIANESDFRTIMQFKLTNEASAPADLYTIGDELRWGSLFGPKIATVEPGSRWYDFELEAVWSEKEELALQRLYLDGEKVAEGNVKLPSGVGVYLKWGLYKDNDVPSSILYHGGIVIAETRESLSE